MKFQPHHLIYIAGMGVIAYFGYQFATEPQPQPSNPPPVEKIASSTSEQNPTTSAHLGPAYLYPDPQKTPGAVNSAISQANISQNICNPNWSTKSERPPASYTSQLKLNQLKSGYNYQNDISLSNYEEDHFISLELGGNPTDSQNLWPEPYNTQFNGQTIGAHEKDKVENLLHKEVCDGTLTLVQAQQVITADWYKVYKEQIQK